MQRQGVAVHAVGAGRLAVLGDRVPVHREDALTAAEDQKLADAKAKMVEGLRLGDYASLAAAEKALNERVKANDPQDDAPAFLDEMGPALLPAGQREFWIGVAHCRMGERAER